MGRKLAIFALIAIGALLLVTVAGVFIYRTVNAAAPAQGANSWMMFGGPGDKGGVSDQALATALGVDVTQLQDAQKTATAEALKQAVSKGLITQAQADQLTTRGFVLRGSQGEAFTRGSGIDYNSLLANALGISVDKLTGAYKTAYFSQLDQAVKDGRITQQQADSAKARYNLINDSKFLSAMQSAFQAAVNQAVKDGVISQSQADQLINGGNGLDGFGLHGLGGGFFRGLGGPGRHGWGNGRFFKTPGNPGTPAPTQTPDGSGL